MNYTAIVRLLAENGDETASLDAAELISHFVGKGREWCLMNPDMPLPPQVESAAREMCRGKPLQYITGRAFFMDDRYFVTPDVLIPQPDTEHIVYAALEVLAPGTKLLDLGCGSGCIIISLLKRTLASGVGVDISEPALRVARRNAELHKIGSRLTFICQDILDSPEVARLAAESDVIVSNPPYIKSDVIPTLSPEVRSEPRLALDGGEDGLHFYRYYINTLSRNMKPDATMILEIGYDQSDDIISLCQDAALSCEIRRDFGGNPRVAIIKRKL